ncbi:MAG: hypothetical protein F9B45_32485 [Phycisphaera sp. RhM]|nr:hypothetical protein [Phycisphaera sp. RhM]
MTMSSDELTHNIAQDFSEFLTNAIGLDDAPADEFFDGSQLYSVMFQHKLLSSLSSSLTMVRIVWLQNSTIGSKQMM